MKNKTELKKIKETLNKLKKIRETLNKLKKVESQLMELGFQKENGKWYGSDGVKCKY